MKIYLVILHRIYNLMVLRLSVYGITAKIQCWYINVMRSVSRDKHTLRHREPHFLILRVDMAQ